MEHLSLVRLQSHLPDCFNALLQQEIFPATCVVTKQVTLGVLQCSTVKKVDKSLPQLLQKVEQSCSFCNGCAKKEIARQDVVLVSKFLCTLCGKLSCVTPAARAPARALDVARAFTIGGKKNEKPEKCETQVGRDIASGQKTLETSYRTSGDPFINGGKKKRTRVEFDKCSSDFKQRTSIHTTQDRTHVTSKKKRTYTSNNLLVCDKYGQV